MPIIRKGVIEADFDLADMARYLEEDLQTDCSYVQDKMRNVFGLDLPFSDGEFDMFVSKDYNDKSVIRFVFPEIEER